MIATCSWRRRHQSAAIAVALGAALALSGCGGNGSDLKTVVSAAQTTLTQGISTRTTLTGATAFGGRPAAIAALGAFSLPTALGYEALALPARGTQPKGIAYLTYQPTHAYIQPVASGGALPAGKLWIVVPFATAGVHTPRLVQQLQGLSPQLPLDEVAWGATAATNAGSSVIGHEPMTVYDVTVDLEKVLASVTGPAAGAIRTAVSEQIAALRRAGAHGSPSLRIRVWVNGPGLVERLQTPVPGSGLGIVRVDITAYAVKMPTSLPTPDTVVDIGLVPAATRTPYAPWALGGGR